MVRKKVLYSQMLKITSRHKKKKKLEKRVPNIRASQIHKSSMHVHHSGNATAAGCFALDIASVFGTAGDSFH